VLLIIKLQIFYLISQNIVSKHCIKACKSVFDSIFTSTKYNYAEVSDTCKPSNNNYYFEDITDLKLKASQRTFL
jgi:hypothetical protein